MDKNFEPSKAVKDYYLYTAKSPVTLGGVTLPGLFSTRYKTPYLLLFLLALILEVYGMVTLYQVGGFHYGFAVLLVLLDLIFAFFSHLPQKNITRLKVQKLLVDDNIRQIQIKRRLNILKLKQNIFYLLIALLAVFKIVSFYSFRGFVDAPFLLLSVVYAIVAVIHIKITGFVVFELVRSMSEQMEYNRYISNGTRGELTKIKHHFTSDTPLVPCSLNETHQLSKVTDKDYALETKGILFDDELTALVNYQQSTAAKAILANEGLRHQFDNILQTERIKI